MKVVRVEDVTGYVWEFPAHAIAHDRATHYAERDKDTTYQDEYDYILDDEYELIDWFLNNMDFDAEKLGAKIVFVPPSPEYPTDATYEVITK